MRKSGYIGQGTRTGSSGHYSYKHESTTRSGAIKVPSDESKIGGVKLTGDGESWVLVHRSSKSPGQWQASYFDSKTPSHDHAVPDTQHDTAREAIRSARANGYEVGKLIDKGFELLILNGRIRKAGGPYIGKRGGKWADPNHTVPWKEGSGKRGKKESEDKKEGAKKDSDGPGEKKEFWGPDHTPIPWEEESKRGEGEKGGEKEGAKKDSDGPSDGPSERTKAFWDSEAERLQQQIIMGVTSNVRSILSTLGGGAFATAAMGPLNQLFAAKKAEDRAAAIEKLEELREGAKREEPTEKNPGRKKDDASADDDDDDKAEPKKPDSKPVPRFPYDKNTKPGDI